MSWVFSSVTTGYGIIAHVTFHSNRMSEWLYTFFYSILMEEINGSDLLH